MGRLGKESSILHFSRYLLRINFTINLYFPSQNAKKPKDIHKSLRRIIISLPRSNSRKLKASSANTRRRSSFVAPGSGSFRREDQSDGPQVRRREWML